ncbi:MAG TPA: hypothetical protein DCZ03_02300, partial [Gammaproteobacteria bacterium]|nr:hypothetical protein [Gammaproteobacteria bacterium]
MEKFILSPLAVIQDNRLSKIQIKVLLCLFSFRNPKNTNTVFPKRKSISERCGYSENTISKA